MAEVTGKVVTVPPELLAKFVAAEKKRSGEIKQFLEEFDALVAEMFTAVGEGNYFQDAEGVVYKMTIPDGTFVHFKRTGYARTRRGDEKKGSLSLDEAKTAGLTPVIPGT